MTDTERKTQRLADALSRAGKATASSDDGTPKRRAVPMNGPVHASAYRVQEQRLPEKPPPDPDFVPPPPVAAPQAASAPTADPLAGQFDPFKGKAYGDLAMLEASKAAAASLDPAAAFKCSSRGRIQHRTVPREKRRRSRAPLYIALALMSLGLSAGVVFWLARGPQLGEIRFNLADILPSAVPLPEVEGAQDSAEVFGPPMPETSAPQGSAPDPQAPEAVAAAPGTDPETEAAPAIETAPQIAVAPEEVTEQPVTETAPASEEVVPPAPERPIAEAGIQTAPIAARPDAVIAPELPLSAPTGAPSETRVAALAPAAESDGLDTPRLVTDLPPPPVQAPEPVAPTVPIAETETLDLAERIAQSVIVTPPDVDPVSGAEAELVRPVAPSPSGAPGQVTPTPPTVVTGVPPRATDQALGTGEIVPAAGPETAAEPAPAEPVFTPVSEIDAVIAQLPAQDVPAEETAETVPTVSASAVPVPRSESDAAPQAPPSPAPQAAPAPLASTELAVPPSLFAARHRIVVHYNPITPGAAEEAERIAASLTASGAGSVGTATIPFAVSNTHVRQYFTEDGRLSAALADAVGPAVTVRDFTGFTPRPLPGLIELWLRSG